MSHWIDEAISHPGPTPAPRTSWWLEPQTRAEFTLAVKRQLPGMNSGRFGTWSKAAITAKDTTA